MRPFLVYAVGEMLGVKSELLDGPPPPPWSAFTHTPSCTTTFLPAMDDDDLRRGQPTVHKAFDEGTAIPAGDALQTLAFSILADHPMPDTGLMANRVRMLSAPPARPAIWHVRRSGTGSGRRRAPDQPRRAGAGAPPQDRGPHRVRRDPRRPVQG